ncbi:MAG: hypothetical protein ACKO9U_25025, partial [Dolichospermum sp.]
CPNCDVALVTLRERYRPIKSLGSGGFGKTYLAQDIDNLDTQCVMPKKNLRFIPILGLSIILFSCVTQNNKPTLPEATEQNISSNESTPASTATTESTSRLSNPKWDYSVFNSDIKTQDGSYEGSYKLIKEPAFDQQNKQVEWIVQYSIPLVENATPVQIDINNSLVKIELANGFRVQFIDIDAVILGEKNLDEEGQGNRRRYTLRVPNSIWEKWSKVAIVKVVRGRVKYETYN